ncbi:hypothetical protein KIPB_013543, partial [Kipferlia bialata]
LNWLVNLLTIVCMFGMVLVADSDRGLDAVVATFAILQFLDAWQEGRVVAELPRFDFLIKYGSGGKSTTTV